MFKQVAFWGVGRRLQQLQECNLEDFLSIWSGEKKWHRNASEERRKLDNSGENPGGREMPEGKKREQMSTWPLWDFFLTS